MCRRNTLNDFKVSKLRRSKWVRRYIIYYSEIIIKLQSQVIRSILKAKYNTRNTICNLQDITSVHGRRVYSRLIAVAYTSDDYQQYTKQIIARFIKVKWRKLPSRWRQQGIFMMNNSMKHFNPINLPHLMNR